ncbi:MULTISPECIES: vWA domain-containing protein [Bacillus cereus group]|uniref:vWA domain-containing protein n=1 Tax=Bacillus cereus group TaxID=86661 RepID=UPI0008FDC643|nr:MULTISPECIES: vWA domain-containing protein [Bacillus cereus group]MCH5436072.1 VWA domain-containing protein [Bacillus paranthracis]MCR6792428.1 VWA domain-containing protein [Bacillus paranthracis]MCU5200155.1 VWA domain-containing protein [Bacillus paranthracis]MCU5212191.1 VWA domain-containing protein [Bacillus paranthracis]MDA2587064.1 VWA domain-containing protein [Bacillus cereus group sp. Bc062]
MKIRICATFMLFLFIWLHPFWTFAKGEEAKERVVSLVYDDSGSMRNNDRWKYANYALQSLVALLDEKDTFSYVPMSKPNDPLNISLTKDKRQTEIEGIGAWKTYLNTPFSAVETAMQSIKKEADIDGKREFWLIVLTDGAFNDLEKDKIGGKEQILQKLAQFKKEMDAKKISLHPILITMEEDLGQQEKAQLNTFKEIWKKEINGVTMPSSGEDGIVKSVNQVAALVANRDPFSSVESIVKTKVVGKKVEITTPFPLKRMTLVRQSPSLPDYQVTQISKPLQLQSSFSIHAPGEAKLFGNIVHISTENEEVIKPGTYTIEVDRDIEKEGLQVLVEPALNYTVSTYDKEDKDRKNVEEMYEDVTAVIEAKPTELPVQSSYFQAEVEIDGKQYAMKWDDKRHVFYYETKLTKGLVRGKVHMNIKGFYRQTKEFKIETTKKPKLSLQTVTKDYEEKVTNLENSKPFIIQPQLDDKPMTEEAVKKLLKSTGVTSKQSINYEIKQHGNQIYIYPRPHYSDTFNFTDTGTVEATIVVQDSKLPKVKKDITLHIQNAPFYEKYALIFKFVIPITLLLLIVGIIVLGWIVRPRFHRKALLYYEWDQEVAKDWLYQSEPELLKNKWWKHYFGIPYRAERKTVQSVTFIAKKGSKSIFVAKESQIVGMIIDGMFITEDEVGMEHKTLYPNELLVIDRGYGKEIYKYECE